MNGMDGYAGWSAIERGTIAEIWKNNIEVEKWFDPAFQEFIVRELAKK
jgi:hypothetical protein